VEYELIALDLDDSLLGKDSKISVKNKEALSKARAAGLNVTLATGRMVTSAMPYVDELKLTLPFIAYNGGMMVEPSTGRTLHHLPLSSDTAGYIIKSARKLDMHINVYINDKVFVEEIDKYAQAYSEAFGVSLNLIDSVLEKVEQGELPTKILTISEPEKISELKQKLLPLNDVLCALTSKPFFLELTHPKATKGQTLKLLAEKLNIDQKRIIAVGDGFNDISMIDYAGLGVAMGNAPDDVKNAADYVTSSNIEDGVAEIIYRFVLKN
jgi:Cof subfamily protein (haloacid dehalogenase superfamily)